MKVSELRELNPDELLQRANTLKRELFDLRMEKEGGKTAKPHRLSQARRDLARVLTLLGQKREAS